MEDDKEGERNGMGTRRSTSMGKESTMEGRGGTFVEGLGRDEAAASLAEARFRAPGPSSSAASSTGGSCGVVVVVVASGSEGR